MYSYRATPHFERQKKYTTNGVQKICLQYPNYKLGPKRVFNGSSIYISAPIFDGPHCTNGCQRFNLNFELSGNLHFQNANTSIIEQS